MSVVNQMLRDLDARGARTGAGPSPTVAAAGLALPARGQGRKPRLALLAVLLAGAMGGAALGWNAWPAATVAGNTPDPVAPPAPLPVVAARVAPRPVAPVVAAPMAALAALPRSEETAEATRTTAVAQPPARANEVAQVPARASQVAQLPARASQVAQVPARATPDAHRPADMSQAKPKPARRARALHDMVALAAGDIAADSSAAWDTITATRAAAPPAPAAGARATTSAGGPQKQFALVDRLQAARDLWQSGQGDAATALLREALGLPSSGDAAGTHAAAVRELARMELMQRDPAHALQTLEQHAGELAGDAPAWSLRGNAAQRLGRHADAFNAFETAVRLQGDDTRSMLGAAVSLAASGDLPRAREWAARARRLGAWPAEVAIYLRQLGVELDH